MSEITHNDNAVRQKAWNETVYGERMVVSGSGIVSYQETFKPLFDFQIWLSECRAAGRDHLDVLDLMSDTSFIVSLSKKLMK
jgi:hypothetical protein